jgi:hypothetical protein
VTLRSLGVGWAIIVTVIVAVAGCARVLLPRQTQLMSSVAGVTMSTSELRERVLELGRRQVALVEEGVSEAYQGTQDPVVRRAVISFGLAAIPDIQEASLNGDPLVALADLWALAMQTEAFSRDGPGPKTLGEANGMVAKAAQQMTQETEKLAELVFGPQDVAQRRSQVKRWADANPITAASFARPTASAVLAKVVGREPQGAMQFIASTDDRLAQLDARLEMMNKSMLGRIRWTVQLMLEDALGAEDVASLTADLQKFVDRERQLAFESVGQERAAIFAQVGDERTAIFKDIARERATITAEANGMLEQASADARRLVDRTLWRLGLGAAVLIALAALAFWIVWHVTHGPRRRVSSRSWPRPAHGSTLP